MSYQQFGYACPQGAHTILGVTARLISLPRHRRISGGRRTETGLSRRLRSTGDEPNLYRLPTAKERSPAYNDKLAPSHITAVVALDLRGAGSAGSKSDRERHSSSAWLRQIHALVYSAAPSGISAGGRFWASGLAKEKPARTRRRARESAPQIPCRNVRAPGRTSQVVNGPRCRRRHPKRHDVGSEQRRQSIRATPARNDNGHPPSGRRSLSR